MLPFFLGGNNTGILKHTTTSSATRLRCPAPSLAACLKLHDGWREACDCRARLEACISVPGESRFRDAQGDGWMTRIWSKWCLESFCGVCEVQDVDRMSITLDLVKWNGLSCMSREGRPRVGSIPREDLIKSTFKQFVANLYDDVQFCWFQTTWKIKKQVQCLSIQGETNLHTSVYHKEHTYRTIVYYNIL